MTPEQIIIEEIDRVTRDTRTDAERRYDAERDGSLYFAPPAEDERIALAAEADRILTADDAELDVAAWIDKRGADYSARLLELLRWIDAHFHQDA